MNETIMISQNSMISKLFPDVVLTKSGKMICVYIECVAHGDRSQNGIFYTFSSDFGKTWSKQDCLVRDFMPGRPPACFNCPRISAMPDGTLVILCDDYANSTQTHLWKSYDDGCTWEEDEILTIHGETIHGIVPDHYRVLSNGRHYFALHRRAADGVQLIQYGYYSDDGGKTWTETVIGEDSRYKLCEASIVEIGDGTLVAFMRENSSKGYPIFKSVSRDYGTTWEGVYPTRIYCGHRPTAGFYEKDRLMLTYRLKQGGDAQNLFAAFFDTENALAEDGGGSIRIYPLAYDCSAHPDNSYSGWVRLPDGSLYVVNYIKKNAKRAYIEGYHFTLDEVFGQQTSDNERDDILLSEECFFHGCAYWEKTAEGVIPHRMPFATEEGYRKIGNVHYPYQSAVRAELVTDAEQIALRGIVLKCMPGRDILSVSYSVDGVPQAPVRFFAANPEFSIVLPLDGKKHRMEFCLPHLMQAEYTHILAVRALYAEPILPKGKRYYAFGDSITQGTSLVESGNSVPEAVAAAFGLELFQFGTASGRYTPEALEGLELLPKPDYVTAALGINDWRKELPTEQFVSDCTAYLDRMDALFPDADITVITPLWIADSDTARMRGTRSEFCDLLCALIRSHPRFRILSGDRMIPADERYFADGLHPNAEGFELYRKNIISALSGYYPNGSD